MSASDPVEKSAAVFFGGCVTAAVYYRRNKSPTLLIVSILLGLGTAMFGWFAAHP